VRDSLPRWRHNSAAHRSALTLFRTAAVEECNSAALTE
jgi:hypothetical protein